MRIKELAPQIFSKEHMYYEQILQAKNWSQIAALHYAQELSNGDARWMKYLESFNESGYLQQVRDTIAQLIRETR